MTLTKNEQARVNDVLSSNPKFGRGRLAAATGISRYRISEYLKTLTPGQIPPAVQTLDAPLQEEIVRPDALSVKDFVGRFDYAGLLRKTIGRLCRSSFVSDAAIRAESGIPPASFRLVAEQPEFKRCQIKHRDGTWWSLEKNADVVRKEIQKWGVQR